MSSRTLQPIAVVGIGCRFPGAENADKYWNLIEGAGTAISRVPDSRLDRELYFRPGEKGRVGITYTELAGVVPETPFDHNRYPIPADLVSAYDGVHLRMLEVCCEAVKSAGMDPLSGLAGSRTGVYIGNTGGSTLGGDISVGTLSKEVVMRLHDEAFADLPSHVRDAAVRDTLARLQGKLPLRNADGGPNVEAHGVSQLVSRAMRLDGPSVSVDAACASSLICVAKAVYALQRGHLDMAIAGGCSFTKWFGLVLFSQAQSISGTGTRPFDESADGLISSDGYAAVMLKPLAKAQADGDPILGVIRSLAIGTDGKGKSLWAPLRDGQIRAVRKAYNDQVKPGSLQYIECHATSTQVGDATEISSLHEAMEGAFPAGKRIPIGSVKGNIGHTLECAGLAGMCKTLLALKHNTIPPQPSVVTPNPDIAWDEVPFYVPQQAEPWPDVNEQGVRRAAVNAFGIGGLNCHFVVDDRPEPQRSAQSAVPAKFGSSIEVKEDERVAVIGIGMIAPDALNTDEFWSLVSSGRSTISEVTPDRWNPDYYYDPNGGPRCSSSKLGAFIRGFEFDWKKHRIPPKQIQNSSPLQYMLLDASDQAFADAGLADMDFPRDRASVIVGTMFGGDFTSHLQIGLTLPDTEQELRRSLLEQGIDPAKADEVVARYREHILNIYPALKDETGSFTSSTLASRLTKTFNMRGGAWALDASDVSSLAGLQAASDLLLTGNSDLVLCASGQRALDITVYEEMGMTGRLSTGRAAPAFDADQQGTVPGEAVGVVLLKRLSDAERDGDRIRGVINGVSLAFNEQDPATAVSGNIQRLVASDASAAMRIDAVETARTANPVMDVAEVSGMQQSLPTQSAAVPLGSTISQIGYTQTASGMISVIKAMLEIEHQTVAPAVSASAPSGAINNTGFQLPQQSGTLGQQLPAGAGRILVSNMDSHGAVGHVLVEGAREPAIATTSTPAATPATTPPVSEVTTAPLQTLRLAAGATNELEALVTSGNIQALSSFTANDKVRLGVIATDADDIARKLPAAKTGLADSQRRHILADNGILITEPGQGGKHLAVVFSGQGAQYSGMLSDWIESSPAVQKFIQEANAALSAAQLPSFEFLTQDEAAQLGEDVLNTQLAVLLADLAAWAALQESGVQPDFIAGHSYGEFPALVAAGAWDLNAAIQATIHRTNAVMGAGVTNAAMVSTTAPPETVNQLMAKLQVPCDIACFNAPDQTIIAGKISDLDQLSEELKAGGFASRTIRVPMPYHSRLMQPAQAPLAAALQQIPITSPTIRFISCGSNRPLETAEDIRANLVAELTEPVRWETLVETLITSDTGMIIESGPRQILTRLNRRIIGARPVMHMALDARPGHAAEQQARIRLLLEMVRESASQAPVMTPAPPQPAAVPAPPPAPAVTPGQTTQTTAASNGTASHQPTTITSPETISMTNDRTKGRITWIDATERRRNKMREAAQAKVANGTAPASASSNGAASKPSTNGVHPQGQPVQNGHVSAPASNGVAPAPVVAPAPAPVAPPAPPQAVAPAAPVAAAPVAVASLPKAAAVPTANPGQELSRDKLESFVLDYVVEQTGYPPELVELDANLEADLGVDSIRKAQLLGEIAETFEIHQATEHINDLSLDDFPHLNSIIEFFLNISESPDAAQAAVALAPTAPPAPQATAAAPVSSPPAPVAASVPAPATAPLTADAAVAIPREELEKFAVSFVVEQTGYPEELVELDTDLEADLGIDSIRKAQLLGEIAEHYQMTSLASQITDLSLDDFPTLEAITDFFFEAAGCTTEHGADSNSNNVVATESAAAQETAMSPVNTPVLDAFQRVPESDRVMQRYVVRAIPDPLPEDTDTSGKAFAGKVVVLGDTGDAKALAERLAGAGSVVDIIAVDGDSEAAVAAFDTSWNQQPVDHLVVMTSDSEQPADWATLRDQQMLVPYFVVQRWVQRRLEVAGKETPPAGILAAVTRLGGDFGIGRRIGNVSGGALTGLFKGVIREYGEITAKIIDAAADEPTERVVDCLCREAASGRADIEIGNIRGQRHRLQMVAQPASGFSPSGSDMAGPWVVTGGARGITARIAAALGRTPGVKLHLVGRSPEPEVDPAWVSLDESGMKELKKDVMRQAAGEGKKPIEVWNSLSRKIDLAKSLQELRDQGLDLTYHACDVSDRESVGNMLQAVRQLHGPITGIIHGAGIEAAARFDRKQADSVRLTVTSKVDGARWLWDQTAEDNLGYYVGFGSTSGRFGGVGQTDYSMSSDLLCRMGWQFGAERPNCRVFGIHWPPWGEVGMAARPESRFALESAGLKFVDTAEGISHLLDEFDICASDGEVAIVDRNMSEDPEGRKNDSELTSLAHTVANQIRTSAFVDGIIDYDANSVTTELSFDPVKHPVVADHMVDDTPVVPGTVLLDTCLQAAEVMAHGRQITEARDFLISNGVRCRNGRPQRVRVKATRQADGSIQCVMTAEFNDQKNRVVDPARPIASVTVITGDALPAGTTAQSLPTEWEVLKQATSPQDFDPHHVGTVYHGPSMGRLKGAIINDATQGWFRIADPQGQNTAPGTDRPAILDALLQGNDLILHRHRGTHHLLRGIDRIVFHQPMENQFELAAYNVLTSDTDDGPIFSSQCFTPDHQAFVTLEGILSYQMKSRDAEIRLPSLTEKSGSEESASQSETPAGGSILRPMVMRAAINKEGMSSVLTVPVDPENDSFFSQHRFRNIPFLPGVMLLEIMGEAAETLAHPGEQAISMENMRILRGVRGGNDIVSLVVRCTRDGNRVSVQLFESERATKPSSEGTVVLGTQLLPLVDTISEPHGDFVDFEYREDTPILHGPEMQSLRELAAWRFLGIAKLQCCETTVVDNFPPGSQCLIDPAILDGAIVACGTDAWAYFGNISEVPDSFDEIVFGTLPQKGEACTVSFVCKTIYKKETTTYDVVLQGARKQTLMQINGFTLRRISGPPTKVDVPGQKEFPNT